MLSRLTPQGRLDRSVGPSRWPIGSRRRDTGRARGPQIGETIGPAHRLRANLPAALRPFTEARARVWASAAGDLSASSGRTENVAARSRDTSLLALLSLAFAACAGLDSQAAEDTRMLERYGVSIMLPDGWHGRLTRGTVEAATVPLHGVSQDIALGAGDVAVELFEFEPDPDSLGAAELDPSYSKDRPRRFTVEEFGPPELGGDNPDHGFTRRNFSLAGRNFDLFAESGTRRPPADAVAALNEIVASLEVRAGDFYPGTIEPPRFRTTSGWHVDSDGGGEVRATRHRRGHRQFLTATGRATYRPLARSRRSQRTAS